MTMSFKETSASLDAVLQTIEAKKKALDDANTAASLAANEYNDAVNKAQVLREQLVNSLSVVLGEPSKAKVYGV